MRAFLPRRSASGGDVRPQLQLIANIWWFHHKIVAQLAAFDAGVVSINFVLLGLVALVMVTLSDWMIVRQGRETLSTIMLTSMLDAIRPMLKWAWIAVGVGIALLLISLAASVFLTHRGPTHSLAAAGAMTLVASVTVVIAGHPWLLGLCFGWGYLSHLLADMLTPKGCPALL